MGILRAVEPRWAHRSGAQRAAERGQSRATRPKPRRLAFRSKSVRRRLLVAVRHLQQVLGPRDLGGHLRARRLPALSQCSLDLRAVGVESSQSSTRHISAWS